MKRLSTMKIVLLLMIGGLAGVFITVSLVTGKENGIMLPVTAVSEEGNERFVFIEEDGGFVYRPVQMKEAGEQNVRALKGITPGEKAVVEGTLILKSEVHKAELKESD